MCARFPAGGAAHHLVNRNQRDVVYLDAGDRPPRRRRDLPRRRHVGSSPDERAAADDE
jgi:uncharacterized cupin superfamily protein